MVFKPYILIHIIVLKDNICIKVMAGAVQRAVKKWRITHLEKYKAQNRKNSITFIEWRRISTIFRRILIAEHT